MPLLEGSSTGRRRRAILLLIVLVALVLRLGFWIGVLGFDSTGGGDEPDYHHFATTVAAGEGFVDRDGRPSAVRPPLYPLALGGLYAVLGPDPDVGRAFQVVLGAVVVLLVYALGSRLFSRRVGLLAAALAAVNPSLIYLSALLTTENLYLVLLLLILLLTARRPATPQPGVVSFAAAGIVGGLLCLTRPGGAAFVLLGGLAALFLSGIRIGARSARAAVFVLLAALVVAPWSIRNQRAFGEFVPFTTQGGFNFYACNNEVAYDDPAFHGNPVLPLKLTPRYAELHGLNELELDRRAMELGMEFVREHGELLPVMAARKLQRYWRFRSGLTFGTASGELSQSGGLFDRAWSRIDIGFAYSIVVVPLFVLGLATTFRRRRDLLFFYAAIVAHMLVAVIFFGSLRVRAPTEPVMVVLAAHAVVGVAALRGRQRTAPARSQARRSRSCVRCGK
jgi:4-amino-4-deoxy-L-arabinose transferase-like glycosyltransferase